MTEEILEHFKKRISKHFYAETKLINDMLGADLSTEEYKQLGEFMQQHPYQELASYLKNIRDDVSKLHHQ